VLLASLVTGGMVMLAVSTWHLRRRSQPETFRRTAALSLTVLVPATLFTLLVGSHLGVIETTYQPMKVAAMEAQWQTCQPCSFSAFQIGGGKNDETPTKIIAIPHLLSLLADDSWDGRVEGLNELNQQYQQQYGPGNYVPNVFIQYWSMRLMAYLGVAVLLLSSWGLWLVRKERIGSAKWFLLLAPWAVIIPFFMDTAGWMLTENGRQPWIVQGLLQTSQGVSPSVSSTMIWVSLTVFVLLYAGLAVLCWTMMFRYGRKEIEPAPESDDETGVSETAAMTY
jgi:cytochrome bd ubiquinol oxidase subunit I